MDRQRMTENKQERHRAVDRQTQRTSRACSLLFQAWMQMGSEVVVGSSRVAADTMEDLNDLYCNPRGGPCADAESGIRD